MPFVRISLKTPQSKEIRKAYADAVHEALVSAVAIPREDRFQIVETLGDDLIYDPHFQGVSRDDGIVFVEVHLSVGRSLEKKRALYAALVEQLGKHGVRADNVFVHLMENTPENWSFGLGQAQYADKMPAHLLAGKS